MKTWTGLLLLAFVVGCAPQQPEGYEDEQKTETGGKAAQQPGSTTKKSSTIGTTTFSDVGTQVEIPVVVGAAPEDEGQEALGLWGNGFGLSSASGYTLSLDGCESGYTASIDEGDGGSLLVYQYDRGCVAKLTSLTFSGVTYSPTNTNGVNFTAWTAFGTSAQTATFANSDGSAVVYVRVVAQLPAQVTGTENIEYEFFRISAGATSTILGTDIDDAHAITVPGVDPPSITIGSVSYVGTTANGAGKFTFEIDCTANVTSSGATTKCLDVFLTNIDYRLVKDTYGSTLNATQAEAIFNGSEKTVAVGDLVTIADSDAQIPHGGFRTDLVTPLEGPDEFHLNPNMILIFRNDDPGYDHDSFTFFNVDITVLTQ
jgi:hypothetical protein